MHAHRSSFGPQFLIVTHSSVRRPLVQKCLPIIHTNVYSRDTERDGFVHDDATVVTAVTWRCVRTHMHGQGQQDIRVRTTKLESTSKDPLLDGSFLSGEDDR